MDLEETFHALAREIAESCRRRRKAETEFRDAAGSAISGWAVHTDRQTDQKVTESASRLNGSSRFSSSSQRTTVLTSSGEVWEYGESRELFEGPEYSEVFGEDPHLTVHSWLRPADSRTLVGSQGKPFADLSSKLERLPYL